MHHGVDRSTGGGYASIMEPTNTTALLHVHDAAARLGVSIYTIRSWLRQRRLAYVRAGRRVLVPASEVDRFIAAHTVPARDEVLAGRRR